MNGIDVSSHQTGFNPRSHEGNDEFNVVLRHFMPVSIHVPTRGTTFDEYINKYAEMKFQSTFPRGERRVH